MDPTGMDGNAGMDGNTRAWHVAPGTWHLAEARHVLSL